MAMLKQIGMLAQKKKRKKYSYMPPEETVGMNRGSAGEEIPGLYKRSILGRDKDMMKKRKKELMTRR